MSEADPHAERPTQWMGRTVHFVHQGKTLSGLVIAQEYNGRRGPSKIADYNLTVRGASGAKLTVSMFDTYAKID